MVHNAINPKKESEYGEENVRTNKIGVINTRKSYIVGD